jgi:hypothetical protein
VKVRNPIPFVALVLLLSLMPRCGWADAGSQTATGKKTQTHPAKKSSQTKPATQTAPEAQNQPVQTQEGVMIRENYFMQLPGIDLSTLTPKQKQRFLDRVNQETCTCGCPNDTIARCLVNDPKCPTVRGLAERVLSEVKAGK